jgi:2-methylisocitrate lyase-like PEP mutase family enzyme
MSAQQLRDVLAAGHTVNMPGIYDALTARLAEQAGFAVGFISGYAVSAARLAAPDLGYVTQTEMADAAREVCRATTMPMIVDADTGYGNALSAIRTARGLAAAGASGLFLEDQVWPKKCGHFAGKRVVAAHEWLTKLRAIVDLRAEGLDLFVVARTDARAAVSLDEAVARAQAAIEIGVDAIFVEAPQSIDELVAIAEATPGAMRVANMVEGGRTPLLTPAELHDLGYDLIVTPLTALLGATRAIREAFAILAREGTMRAHRELLVDFAEFGAVVDLPAHQALEHRYTTEPEERPV